MVHAAWSKHPHPSPQPSPTRRRCAGEGEIVAGMTKSCTRPKTVELRSPSLPFPARERIRVNAGRQASYFRRIGQKSQRNS